MELEVEETEDQSTRVPYFIDPRNQKGPVTCGTIKDGVPNNMYL